MNRLLLSLVVLMFSFFIIPANAKKSSEPKLYIAAALFNARETLFNLALVKQMEHKNYKTIFPQRDGFEYKNLAKITEKYLPNDQVAKTVRDLIYLLDMGIFIPESDIVVANLDEPLDEGVIVEVTYAHLMGKPVIGFRTDARAPFGVAEGLGGMHAFVAFQCDYLIIQSLSSANERKAQLSLNLLVDKIDKTIKSISLTKESKISDNMLTNTKSYELMRLARQIIGHPQTIHTDEGLNATIKRLSQNKVALQPFIV